MASKSGIPRQRSKKARHREDHVVGEAVVSVTRMPQYLQIISCLPEVNSQLWGVITEGNVNNGKMLFVRKCGLVTQEKSAFPFRTMG